MSRTTKAFKRLGVGGVAVATIGAGLPVLLATSASAQTAPATAITISPTTARAVAGNCTPVTLSVRDASGAAASTGNVRIQISSVGAAAAGQTVGVCTGTSPDFVAPGGDALNSTTTTRDYAVSTAAGAGNLTVAVFASQPGQLTITPYVDRDNNQVLSGNDLSGGALTHTIDPVNNTFVSGTATNNETVATITAALATGVTTGNTQVGGDTRNYVVTARNANNAVVNNVEVRYRTSGPGTTATTVATCGRTNSLGQVTCAVAAPAGGASGTQTVTFFVNRGVQTADELNTVQAGEATAAVTRQVSGAASTATTVTVAPNGQTLPTGQEIGYTATVTDVNGVGVPGVVVTFGVSGAGRQVSATNTVTTDANGRAGFNTTSAANENGTQTVTADIRGGVATACPAGSTTAACRATATNTLTPGAVAPTTQPTASPTGTATASPTASATGTATASPTAPACMVANTVVNTNTITVGQRASVSTRVAPNSVVQLFAYSRPSTQFRLVRQAVAGASGQVDFDNLVPPTNTRLYAQQQGCTAGNQVVINVRTALGLTAVRTGMMTYRFEGRLLPRNQATLVTLYRVDAQGREILTAQAVSRAGEAGYSMTRRFTGRGTFDFVARTSQTLINAPGVSNVVRVNIR